jgi:hypothetical protein
VILDTKADVVLDTSELDYEIMKLDMDNSDTNKLADEVRRFQYYGVPEKIAEKHISSLQYHVDCVIEAGHRVGTDKNLLRIHDLSKWTETEFVGYALNFHGDGAPDRFATSLLHHFHNNPHHWQHWILPDRYTPKGSAVENGVVEMPYHYVLEMVADWMGAGRTHNGSWDMSDWLVKNLSKIKIHSKTDYKLRSILDTHGYAGIV